MKKLLSLFTAVLLTATAFGQDIELNGTVSAQNNQIKNLADPTDDQDAVTKSYTYSKSEVDALIAEAVAGHSEGSTAFFNNIEALDAIVPVNSCSTEGDPQGFIAPAGSAWTTSQAIGFNTCYQTPNGIWRDGGCSGTLYYPDPPPICGIDISSPVPSQIEHLYSELDSSKVEITLPEGNQCFEIIMRVEFIGNNGQAIPSFVEHKYVTSSVSYIQTDYISSNVIQEFNLSSINPYNYGYLLNKLVFNLPNNASILKVTFIAPTPDFSNFNPCDEDSYSTVYQTYYSNGIMVSPSLAWLDGSLFYEINKWQ